jgi:hypothetical protein
MLSEFDDVGRIGGLQNITDLRQSVATEQVTQFFPTEVSHGDDRRHDLAAAGALADSPRSLQKVLKLLVDRQRPRDPSLPIRVAGDGVANLQRGLLAIRHRHLKPMFILR